MRKLKRSPKKTQGGRLKPGAQVGPWKACKSLKEGAQVAPVGPCGSLVRVSYPESCGLMIDYLHITL